MTQAVKAPWQNHQCHGLTNVRPKTNSCCYFRFSFTSVPSRCSSPHLVTTFITGPNVFPFAVNRYASRPSCSGEGYFSTSPCSTRRVSRLVRMFVAIRFRRRRKLLEVFTSKQQVAHNQQRPLVTEDVERAGDGAAGSWWLHSKILEFENLPIDFTPITCKMQATNTCILQVEAQHPAEPSHGHNCTAPNHHQSSTKNGLSFTGCQGSPPRN